MAAQRPRSKGHNTLQPPSTVLIIDDNHLVRQSYRTLLKANGFAVVEVDHGADALLWLRRDRADIIVLTLEVPVLGGRSFLEHRLRSATLQAIPVLITSSRLDDAELRRILSHLGADLLLQKPLNPKDLLSAVQEILARPPRPTVPIPEAARGRQDARVAFSIPLRIHTRSAADASGRLHDLSAGGLSAYLPDRLHHGEPITVTLDIEGLSLTLLGFVQWGEESWNTMGYRHGIRFTEKQEDSFPLHAYSFFRLSLGQN